MGFLNSGEITLIFLFAGPLTLALGILTFWLYRRGLEREMRSASNKRPAFEEEMARRRPQSQLHYKTEEIESEQRSSPSLLADPSVPGAAIYALAGTAFGISSIILLFAASGIEFRPLRTACVAWAYAWPVVLTLNLIWTGDRRRQAGVIACYAFVIAFFCLWSTPSGSRPTTIAGITFAAFLNPVLLWVTFAEPGLYLLLFLNRTVRAIGPIVLVFTTLALGCRQIALIALGSPIGTSAAHQILHWTNIGANGLVWTVDIAGLAAGLAIGWITVRWLAAAYAARCFSEQTMVIDSIWFGQSLILCMDLGFEIGVWAGLGLIPFAIYKAVCLLWFRQLSTKLQQQPLRLLLLRVFGFRGRSSRLFDLIGSRWRYLGSIRVIAAPDLASRTIEASKLLAFVRGRLGGLFVRDEAALFQRL